MLCMARWGWVALSWFVTSGILRLTRSRCIRCQDLELRNRQLQFEGRLLESREGQKDPERKRLIQVREAAPRLFVAIFYGWLLIPFRRTV